MPAINPPAERLGQENAILSGRGTRYHVPDFEGCLSIKTVVHGAALWQSENRRFRLQEDGWLVLNDRQRYTITIDSISPVTTFCVFFERGFVEEIYRAQVSPDQTLLDSPTPSSMGKIEFFNGVESGNSPLTGSLKNFYTKLQTGRISSTEWDRNFLCIGRMLVAGRSDTMSAIARLPAVRTSTRVEVYRRLLRGRDFLLASLSEPIRLKEIAAAACLSPFHFHRAFTCAFGETPHGYLTRHRLCRAETLLRDTGMSVTEICLATGFESSTSFSNLFSRHYGAPPRKFARFERRRIE